MKLLVSGGAGYIGSHVVHQLSEAGHEVVVLDNLYSGFRWAVPKSVKLVVGDVGDRNLVAELCREHEFDALLHFAAHIEVGESVLEPAKYYRNNTAHALELFSAVHAAGVKQIIFSSTAAVYGEPGSGLLNETQPLKPVNPYGASKMMTERILTDLAARPSSDLRFVILRYFNVAGARLDLKIGQATPRATHLIKIAAETAIGKRAQMSIHGTDYPTADGTCERDYIHVEDLAHAHLDALKYLTGGGKSNVFNVGYGKPYSVREVINTMKKVSGNDFKVVEGPRREGDPSALAADSQKLKQTLSWRPQYDNLELICKTALDWEKKLQTLNG